MFNTGNGDHLHGFHQVGKIDCFNVPNERLYKVVAKEVSRKSLVFKPHPQRPRGFRRVVSSQSCCGDVVTQTVNVSSQVRSK